MGSPPSLPLLLLLLAANEEEDAVLLLLLLELVVVVVLVVGDEPYMRPSGLLLLLLLLGPSKSSKSIKGAKGRGWLRGEAPYCSHSRRAVTATCGRRGGGRWQQKAAQPR